MTPADDRRASHATTPDQSSALQAGTIALFVVYGIAVLGDILPPALMSPLWQLRFAKTLINNAYLPLLGVCIFHIWNSLLENYGQQSRYFLDFWTKIRRLAVLASLGFLLLVPLQARSAWQLIHTNFRGIDAQSQASRMTPQGRLDAMEKIIRDAPNAQIMQNRLAILRGPAIQPQDLQRPLPELKTLLLQALERARQNINSASQEENKQRVWILIQECVRDGLASIAYAGGFAAFAQGRRQNQTLLQQLLDKLQPNAINQERQRMKEFRKFGLPDDEQANR